MIFHSIQHCGHLPWNLHQFWEEGKSAYISWEKSLFILETTGIEKKENIKKDNFEYKVVLIFNIILEPARGHSKRKSKDL